MTFAFDEQFAMFDVTPVENQFILEYLPGARGDDVRVYLYGLLCCYHPKQEMNLDSMSLELGLTREEIMNAFRRWERKGVVRRISDNPPSWQYVNIKQMSLMRGEDIDPEYTEFYRVIESSMDGIWNFRGSDIAACYEWREGLGLPTEVILMLLKEMVRTRGKNFKIRDAEKTAVRLAEEKAFTEEEASALLSADEAASSGMKKILRLMGKRYAPSEAQLALYRKWTAEWRFSPEAIEEALAGMGTKDPSLDYLDAVLNRIYSQQPQPVTRILGPEDVCRACDEWEEMKTIRREAGWTGSITPEQEKLLLRMRTVYNDAGILMIAARECGRKQKDPESALKLLQSWKARGFSTRQEIETHISQFRDKEDFLKEIKSRWKSRSIEVGERNLEMLDKWENTLGMSREVILKAADYAADVRRPMPYMDALLTRYAEKGIRTAEAAEKDHQQYAEQYREMKNASAATPPPARQYQQRDYTGKQREATERMLKMLEGDEDA